MDESSLIARDYLPADGFLTDEPPSDIEAVCGRSISVLCTEELLNGLESAEPNVRAHDDDDEAAVYVRKLVEEVSDLTYEAWVFDDGSMVVRIGENAEAVDRNGWGARDGTRWVRRGDQLDDARVVEAIAGFGIPGLLFLEDEGLLDLAALLESSDKSVREWAILRLRDLR
jgi:hypothetical protein